MGLEIRVVYTELSATMCVYITGIEENGSLAELQGNA